MSFILRRAKIVATLGPATDDARVMNDVVRAGVDVVRINFSHGQLADHKRRLDLVRDAGLARLLPSRPRESELQWSMLSPWRPTAFVGTSRAI